MFGFDIVNRARVALNDTVVPYRWADAEFTLWINDGCMFVALRSDATATIGTLTCLGGPLQRIDTMAPPGLRLLDSVRNLTTGRAMRLVDKEDLDAEDPGWYSSTAGDPTNWVYDARIPKRFYVYPPAVVGRSLEVSYAAKPVVIGDAELGTVALSIGDEFIDALLNYVLFRAKLKEDDVSKDGSAAAAYLQLAEAMLGVKTTADRVKSPALTVAGGKPTTAAQSGGV